MSIPLPPEAIAAIIGLFLPAVVSLLKRPGWPRLAKLSVAGAASLAAGAFSTWASGQLDLADTGRIFTSAASAFSIATAIYKGWFEGLKLNEKLTLFKLP